VVSDVPVDSEAHGVISSILKIYQLSLLDAHKVACVYLWGECMRVCEHLYCILEKTLEIYRKINFKIPKF
jgi:hypothetical protein